MVLREYIEFMAHKGISLKYMGCDRDTCLGLENKLSLTGRAFFAVYSRRAVERVGAVVDLARRLSTRIDTRHPIWALCCYDQSTKRSGIFEVPMPLSREFLYPSWEGLAPSGHGSVRESREHYLAFMKTRGQEMLNKKKGTMDLNARKAEEQRRWSEVDDYEMEKADVGDLCLGGKL